MSLKRNEFVRSLAATPALAAAATAQSGSVRSQSAGMPFGDLGTLPLLGAGETRSVCPENPTGGKGKGGMAIPNPADPDLPFSAAAVDLGRKWKVRPFIKPKAGETVTIMDVEGPGIIQHIWMASERNWRGNGRATILRFYWDEEPTPSVEAPLTDFFAVGHDLFAPVNSLPVVVNAASALNCYWPMPFGKRARITLTNERSQPMSLFTYQITYQKLPLPDNAGRFHAQWRRSVTPRHAPEHVILDGVKGEGQYVGTFLAWTQLGSGWWGEGELKFFLDGDKDFPTIAGTGTEDYFGASYGFPELYSTPFLGNTLKHSGQDGPPKWSLYRWHVLDPISFKRDLKLTIQALGWYPTPPPHQPGSRYRPLEDDVASLAFWYQREPHAPFPKFPELAARWPR